MECLKMLVQDLECKNINNHTAEMVELIKEMIKEMIKEVMMLLVISKPKEDFVLERNVEEDAHNF